MKSEIVGELGQSELLLPALIADGLAANDRVKIRLSVLQSAGRHARDPQGARFDLTEECRAAGLDSLPLEALVNSASLLSGDEITAPGLAKLGAAIWDDMGSMAHGVEAGLPAEGKEFRARLSTIRKSVSLGASDNLTLAQIATLTALANNGGDSLHRVIMDLHKALNGLAATHAQETIAGAHAYGVLTQDRPAIEAFMRGVEATRKLKFNHPGLATTATRAGERLTIQNDIGETEAHVVVIAVDAGAVTVTYTDVHHPRTKFFTGLLRDFSVQWSGLERKTAAGLGDEGSFYLVTGRYPFTHNEERDAFLETLGASLVFLIDWNKARKILREWISNDAAIRVLDWAARHHIGHRGFLELGGADLVASAVRHAAPSRIGFGERLDHTLGRSAAVDFLKAVLKISTETLLHENSLRLARSRMEEALIARLQRADTALLAIVIRQGGLAREISAGIAQLIAERQAGRPLDCSALTKRAAHIEEKADRIALEARSEIARIGGGRGIEHLVNEIENAIDELEEAAFAASLLPAAIAPDLLARIAELSAATLAGTKAAVIGTAAAAEIPEGQRIDFEDALATVNELIDVEHKGDAIERAIKAEVLTADFDLKTALSVRDLARALERATDRLARFGHVLREHVLADLSPA